MAKKQININVVALSITLDIRVLDWLLQRLLQALLMVAVVPVTDTNLLFTETMIDMI
jgi:hypothetical protein